MIPVIEVDQNGPWHEDPVTKDVWLVASVRDPDMVEALEDGYVGPTGGYRYVIEYSPNDDPPHGAGWGRLSEIMEVHYVAKDYVLLYLRRTSTSAIIGV